MTWKTGTIKLDAAQAIFNPLVFERIEVGGKTVGYKVSGCLPNVGEFEAEDTSLTALCQRIWVSTSGV